MKRIIACGFLFLFGIHFSRAAGEKVFGREFFENIQVSQTTTGRLISENYILGPGDQINISVLGAIELSYSREIDNEGNIFIERIGNVYLDGKTLSEARTALSEVFRKTYRNIRVEIALNKTRLITVFAIGELGKPGAFVVSPTTNILELIGMAGGITERGSFRHITIRHRDGKSLIIDLYPMFFGTMVPHIIFQPEDVLFVPLREKTATVRGAVRRPAIYELSGQTTLSDLVGMAGGFLPEADLKKVQITRKDASGERVLIDVFLAGQLEKKLNEFLVQDGDEAEISFLPADVYNKVSIEGAVKNPGNYQWKEGLKISDILKERDLLPDALTENAELIRETDTGAKEIIAFSPQDAVAGKADVSLKPRDRIVIRSKSKPVPKCAITGEVKYPGEYVINSGETVSSLIKRAGGFTDAAYLPGAVFTRVSVKQREKEQLEKFVAEKTATIEKESQRAQGEEEKALIEQSKTLLEQLSKSEVTGRIVVRLSRPSEMQGTADDIALEPGDAIYIPKKPATVNILGEVNHSANIMYRPGAPIEYYIDKSGSFTRNADRKNIFIVKADGTATRNLKQIDCGDVVVVGFLARERSGKIFRDVVQMVYEVSLSIGALKK